MTVTGQWFGRRPPTETRLLAAWGARAILAGRATEQSIDILPDRRQLWTPDDGPVPEAFKRFLTEDVAAWLDRACDAEGGSIDAGGAEVLFIETGDFRAEASAQRSHGYLYIGAWMKAPEPETAPASP
jgi:hypothetical protein